MKKVIKKILLIVIILFILVIIKLSSKIIVNHRFINKYPDADQEYRLKIISFANLYQPYIAPYNYGNYLYYKERYDEAATKYKESLTYPIPKKRYCSVKINLSLTLIKMSILENDDLKALDLLKEAKQHVNQCIMLGVNNPDYNDDDLIAEEELLNQKNGTQPGGSNNPNDSDDPSNSNDPNASSNPNSSNDPNASSNPNPSSSPQPSSIPNPNQTKTPNDVIDIITNEIENRWTKVKNDNEKKDTIKDIQDKIKEILNETEPITPKETATIDPDCHNCW